MSMKRLALHILAVAALGTMCVTTLEARFLRAGGRALPGTYIVVLNDSVTPEQADPLARRLANQYGGRHVVTLRHAIVGFGVMMPEAAAIALSRHPLVKLVEEDAAATLSAGAEPFDFATTRRPAMPAPLSHTSCPWNSGGYYLCNFVDDTFWHLDRLDNMGPIYSVKRYGYASSGNGVRAYVVDYGVYAGHSEFEGRVEVGANMYVNPMLSDPVEPGSTEEPAVSLDYWSADNPCGSWRTTADHYVGHGTGVASILAGKTTGVAKHATIVPVKVGGCSPYRPIRKLAVATGLDWIYQDMANRPNSRAVVNLSYSWELEGRNLTDTCDDNGQVNCISAIESEINSLVQNGIVVVVSANNQGQNRCATQTPARMGYGNEGGYPSPYRVITVGGTMYTGNYVDRSWHCNAQPGGCASSGDWAIENPGTNFGPCVSVYAPAWNLRVAGVAGPDSFRTGVGPSSGTSWAAPYVAGVAARLLEMDPTLTSLEVWQQIVERANLRITGSSPDFDPGPGVNKRLVYMPATE